LLLLLCLPVSALCQDTGFSQFYSNPLYLNPAFAGTLEVPRVTLQYRDQWPSMPDAYVTQSAAFDFPSKRLKGGAGINLVRDGQAANLMDAWQLNIMYAPVVRLRKSLFLSGALQAGYRHHALRWGELVFPDNLDRYGGVHGVTAENPPASLSFHFFDYATGVLLFGERLFAGAAIHHLGEPRQGWYRDPEGGGTLQRKYTLHFGTRLPVRINDHWRKSFDVLPQVILMQQGIYRQFSYGLLADFRGLTGGLWLRQDFAFHYDALVILAGFMKKRWHITYSYDFTISGLGTGPGGAHEFSLGFLLKDFHKQSAFPFYQPYHDYLGE